MRPPRRRLVATSSTPPPRFHTAWVDLRPLWRDPTFEQHVGSRRQRRRDIPGSWISLEERAAREFRSLAALAAKGLGGLMSRLIRQYLEFVAALRLNPRINRDQQQKGARVGACRRKHGADKCPAMSFWTNFATHGRG
jgi:hypothetical protein